MQDQAYCSRFSDDMHHMTACDSIVGPKSFMYRKSTSNQRIEPEYENFRKLGIHWRIMFFKDLRDSETFDFENRVTNECLRFCFRNGLQTD